MMALNTINFVAVLTVSVLSLISAQTGSGKLQIDVHYESRCPDSRNFMQQQLKKTYPNIKDNVIINYIPFGKANSFSRNGETLFSCQHGLRECDGNRYQSCVMDVIGQDDQDRRTNFVICAMDFNKNPSNCAQNLGVDLVKVNLCNNGERGIQLQLEAEKASTDIIAASGFVPTIVYGKTYRASDFWESLEDFEGVAKRKIN